MPEVPSLLYSECAKQAEMVGMMDCEETRIALRY